MQTVLTAQYYKQQKSGWIRKTRKYSQDMRYACLTGAFGSIIDGSLMDMKVLENRIEELENQIEKLEQEKELMREKERED